MRRESASWGEDATPCSGVSTPPACAELLRELALHVTFIGLQICVMRWRSCAAEGRNPGGAKAVRTGKGVGPQPVLTGPGVMALLDRGLRRSLVELCILMKLSFVLLIAIGFGGCIETLKDCCTGELWHPTPSPHKCIEQHSDSAVAW